MSQPKLEVGGCWGCLRIPHLGDLTHYSVSILLQPKGKKDCLEFMSTELTGAENFNLQILEVLLLALQR